MENIKSLDLVRGSLIGGAAGDALGYTVEFSSYHRIISEYGARGITEYELTNGVAEFSDDTQMTLFTANGMLTGLTRMYTRGIGRSPEFYVEQAYKDWYYTQTDSCGNRMGKDRFTWLSAIPGFYSRRAPGNTCMSALSEMIYKRTPQNNSKGCGGVMRVAPWGLFCACHDVRYSIAQMDVAGGEIARLTHKHPLGWMPSILMTHILYRIVKEGGIDVHDKTTARKRFDAIVMEALNLLPQLIVMDNVSEVTWKKEDTLDKAFHSSVVRQKDLVEQALRLADNNSPDVDNIRHLGEGWVGEEALAIAVYAVARHIDSFADTLIAAVNHDGDSDSTGAIAGNIIGAMIGYEAIPAQFKTHLEMHDVILAIADDLHQGCIIDSETEEDTPEKKQWYDRYVDMQPAGFEE